jgi:hypothetical protein
MDDDREIKDLSKTNRFILILIFFCKIDTTTTSTFFFSIVADIFSFKIYINEVGLSLILLRFWGWKCLFY